MGSPSSADRPWSAEEAHYLDRACDAFESAWRAGQRPAIEPFLADAPPSVRKNLLNELIQLDVAYRRQHGEQPALHDYRQRFAESFDETLFAKTPAEQPTPALPTVADVPAHTFSGAPSAPAVVVWPPVAGYEIAQEIGRGGMGVVYRAKQLAARRWVALKMIRDGVLAGPEHRQRFRIEAEAAARFQHPNLVRIYEVGEHAGLPYFSMELAEGGSLDKRLAGQSLPNREAADLVRTLAEAVAYAHAKQVVHRDLKPANVVLTADGRPLITDFGLAKRLDSSTAMTGSEAILGTAGYMAPEQAAGHAREVGPAADIYALGAILYELLTGRPPFRAASWQEAVQQVLYDEPIAPTQLRADTAPDLETICLKCLEKDPKERYSSASALALDLQRFLTGESISISPTTDLERQARWAERAGFEIEEVLTYGVRDAVYKARQVHLNRSVALKILTVLAATEPHAVARLRQEAQAVALLDHPNIVRIYSSGELAGRTYLAFEYVPGGSLVERFADQPVRPSQAAQLVRQLAEAMQYAHGRGVLHCALKPSNILLTADGTPKITNFGLSVLLEQPEAERHLTFRRLPTYMAPELVDGRAPVGPTADVYALGAILYTLLTGQPPFLGETVAQTTELVRSHEPPSASLVQGGVPKVLDAVCWRCLAKEPIGRYQSAGELAATLADFLGADRSTLPQPGALPEFPGYETIRELGRGTLTVVYEVQHRDSGRRLALKTMRPDVQSGRPVRELLRDVAQSVARLRHPNIVEVHECFQVAGRLCILMELLPGGSLAQRPARQMPVIEAAVLVATLARTLATVHRQGIIHGDLKPSKVLLTADGMPKITAFVIGRHQKEPPPEQQMAMTMHGPQVMGTPRYLAPEQLLGNTKAIGPATDVHALGLILYELLTGWLPYRAVTLWEMMAQVANEPPQPPRALRADLPADLETICLHCLAKQPEQRYPHAGILAEELDHFLAGKPLSWQVAPNPEERQPLHLPPEPPQESAPGAPSKLSPPAPAGVWRRLAEWFMKRGERRTGR
jgi:serine/threonine protein kinase